MHYILVVLYVTSSKQGVATAVLLTKSVMYIKIVYKHTVHVLSYFPPLSFILTIWIISLFHSFQFRGRHHHSEKIIVFERFIQRSKSLSSSVLSHKLKTIAQSDVLSSDDRSNLVKLLQMKESATSCHNPL